MALTAAGLNKRQETGIASFLYMAVGTGAQAGDPGAQTALAAELVRVAISSATVTGAIASFSALLTNSQGNGTLTEVGVYDAAAAGNLLSYQLISPALVKTSARGRILRISETLANAT